jgi:hypothetical protein
VFSSTATDNALRQAVWKKVQETPDEDDGKKVAKRTLVVAESPDTEVTSSRFVSRIIPPREDEDGNAKPTSHPVFDVNKLINNRDLESEDTFVNYVAATQDLASTQIEDGVTPWGGDDEEVRQTPEDMSLTMESEAPLAREKSPAPLPSIARKTPSSRRRRSSRMGPNELCQMFMQKEANDSRRSNNDKQSTLVNTPTTSAAATSAASTPSRRKSRILLEGAADVSGPRVQYFKSPLTLSPKRRPRPSSAFAIGSPSRSITFSSQGSDKTLAKVKRRVTDILERLDEDETKDRTDDVSKSSDADAEDDLQPKNSFPNFSTDSAQALMQQYEALSQGKVDELKQDEETEAEVPESEALTPPMADDRGTASNDGILSSVSAFVEVRTVHENRSQCVQDQLKALGATICARLTKDVTHVIFKDGGLSTYNKAKKLGTYIVSVTWIEGCKREGRIVDEALFPTMSKEKYDSPSLFPKLRKAKSMQPKYDEERSRQVEAAMKRREKTLRKKKDDEKDKSRKLDGSLTKMHYPVPLHYYNSPRLDEERRQRLKSKVEDPDNIMNVLNEMDAAGEEDEDALSQSSQSSEDFNTPLARRLVNKFHKLNRSGSALKRRSSVATAAAASANESTLNDSESEVSQILGERRDNVSFSVTDSPMNNDVSGVAMLSSPVAAERLPEERLPMKRRLIVEEEEEESAQTQPPLHRGQDRISVAGESGDVTDSEKVKPRFAQLFSLLAFGILQIVMVCFYQVRRSRHLV